MNAKRNISRRRRRASRLSRTNSQRKLQIAVVAFALLLVAVTGITVAFLLTRTPPIENVFSPTEVSCEVLEGEDGYTFDGETKTDVRIKNTGKTDAYIRANVVVTWMSADGSTVYAANPVEGTDYTIVYSDSSSGWKKAADGFYYYTLPVAPDNVTADLIESCVCNVTPPVGFRLSVEIVASAIQSQPKSVVAELWTSGIAGVNGEVLSVKDGGAS